METFVDILRAFGFSSMREWIIITSSLLFLMNFLGGMIAGFTFVNTKSIKKPKRSQRISFRMFILSEIILLFAAAYYHLFMIEELTTAHLIYWASAMLMMPLLAVIGAQLVYVAFSGKIKAKRRDFIERAEKTRAAREAAATVAKPAPKPPSKRTKPAKR